MKYYSKITDVDKIISYLEDKSTTIIQYISENKDSDFLAITKTIKHSDLLNSGKRNGKNEGLDKNILYYLNNKEMVELEKTGVIFESAKQSNIGIPTEFFDFLDIPKIERRKGKQTTNHKHIKINDYADVFLVNDSLEEFNISNTNNIISKLGKKTKWNDVSKNNFELNHGPFTEVQLTHAIHGLGTSEDDVFSQVRKNIFKEDTFIVLLEIKSDGSKLVFILLKKNPIYYNILGKYNTNWVNYLHKTERFSLREANFNEIYVEEITRSRQSKWRDQLADEMKNYTSKDDVFCPISFIENDYNDLGTLYRASHIKPFSESNIDEVYDINNGLLLIANADALFDKYLISIDQTGTILYSFLLDTNFKLKQQLNFQEKIFTPLLNSKRLEYLKHHEMVFKQKEIERKKISN